MIDAQTILKEWAIKHGYSTNLDTGVNSRQRVWIHYGKYDGFAYVDVDQSPRIILVVSNEVGVGANPYTTKNPYASVDDHRVPGNDVYDLSLADEKVFSKIERILERTIDSYEEWSND